MAQTQHNRFPLWLGDDLVLASKSRGRAEILRRAGIPFIAVDSGFDERELQLSSGLSPRELAQRLACEKARLVSRSYPNRIVVGADQVLSVGDAVVHKSEGVEQAKAQLRALRARRHELHSAVACWRNGASLFRFVDTAGVTMRAFSETTLDAYVEAMGDAILQTVGGYEIEGLGANLIDRVDGDMFTVVGLPLFELLRRLRALDPTTNGVGCE